MMAPKERLHMRLEYHFGKVLAEEDPDKRAKKVLKAILSHAVDAWTYYSAEFMFPVELQDAVLIANMGSQEISKLLAKIPVLSLRQAGYRCDLKNVDNADSETMVHALSIVFLAEGIRRWGVNEGTRQMARQLLTVFTEDPGAVTVVGLWCRCGRKHPQRHPGGGTWVNCEQCQKWSHWRCVKRAREDLPEKDAHWVCGDGRCQRILVEVKAEKT